MEPGYLKLYKEGTLQKRADEAYQRLAACDLCAHRCRVNRLREERGFCRATAQLEVADYGPHFGEEKPLVGRRGSGTVFFRHCTMKCVFCQNCNISWGLAGPETTFDELAQIMLDLQEYGCHNINFVTPSHYVPQILQSLVIAVEKGLSIPLVYNSSGYESISTLRTLEGVIDIYLPDFKYHEESVGRQYSGVNKYPEVAREAVREMYRQVGNLTLDEDGVAVRGLLIRHLVLPGGLAGTEEILDFLAREISPQLAINIMDQYRPEFQAWQFPPLDRAVSREEFLAAKKAAMAKGFSLIN